MLGILLVAKELGGTSHDVVNAVRRRFSTKRVGHAGTLDPLATGLLVIAVGPATRFLQYLALEPKEYVAEIRFGHATTTYDLEGQETEGGPLPENLGGAILEKLPQFTGLIQQVPPMYSAVKKDGQPLYKIARKGGTVEREPRTVHISEFELLDVGKSDAKARIVCSGGTYIRSLAHDLGIAVGCGAHLSGLVRTGVGRYRLEQAKPLSELSVDDLLPLKDALNPMPFLQLDQADSCLVRDGRSLVVMSDLGSKKVALIDPTGNVLGVAQANGFTLHPECVLPKEVQLNA